VLAGEQRRALDSVVLDDAVATQDTVTQLIAAVRRVIREVPGAPEVAAAWCIGHDYADPGKPKIAWDDEAARAALVDALVTDALNLLAHLPRQRLSGQAANAVGLLALVAGQDVEPATGSDGTDGRWRTAKRTAKGRRISTADPGARHIHKNRTRHQDGFKGHVPFEPETGLFTAVALTRGGGTANHEAAVAGGLPGAEDGQLTILGDTAYGTGALREHLQARGHLAVIKPPPLPRAIPGGFTIGDFTVDDQAGTATCRPGTSSPPAAPRPTATARPSSNALPRLPATTALHHLQRRAGPHHPPPPRPAGRRSPRRRRPSLARRIPAMAAPGRTGHRLARSPRQPPRPLPRRHQKPTPGSTTGPPPSTSAG
jgi:hypothetical protein